VVGHDDIAVKLVELVVPEPQLLLDDIRGSAAAPRVVRISPTRNRTLKLMKYVEPGISQRGSSRR